MPEGAVKCCSLKKGEKCFPSISSGAIALSVPGAPPSLAHLVTGASVGRGVEGPLLEQLIKLLQHSSRKWR